MARPNATGLTPQILRPVAAPVDTFVRPKEGVQLAQLAEGLSQFAPALARFGGVMQEQQNAREKIAGENKARDLAESGKTYRQAIEQGLISPHESPWFRVGAYETFGRTSAHKYSADLQVALAQSNVSESTDPKDFDKFESDFRGKWQKENLGDHNDAYFSNAFGQQADSLVNGARANFAETAGARLIKQTGEAFHAEVFSIIQDGYGKKATPEAIATNVNLALSRQIATGMNKGIANQLAASAITQAAKRANDASLLDVLDKIKLGTGTLAGTHYGSNARELAENEIADVNQRRHAAIEANLTREKQHATDAIVASAIEAFQQAPDARLVNISPYVEQMRKVNPEKAETLLKMQDAWTDHAYKGDPIVTQHLFMGVFDGSTGMNSLNSALASRQVDQKDYVEMANLLRRRDKEDNKITKFFNDDGFKEGKSRLEKLFVTQFGQIEKPGNAVRYNNALSEFTASYFRFRESGGGTDVQAVNKFLTDHVDRMFTKFGDGSQKADRDAIPKANLGPQKVDWKKDPVADVMSVTEAQREWNDWLGQKRSSLSHSTLDLLDAAGVDISNHNEVKQFFLKQLKMNQPVLVK